MQEIVLSLDEMGRRGARTTMVKVHGHTGEPQQAVADAMATEGADRKMEAVNTAGAARVDNEPDVEKWEDIKRPCKIEGQTEAHW